MRPYASVPALMTTLRCPNCLSEPPTSRDRICVHCPDFAYLEPDALKAARRDPFLGKVLDGRFAITGRVAAGGSGAIYRGYQLPVDRQVAIKLVRPELLGNVADVPVLFDRFRREARIVSRLNHPHIVTLHDFGETEDGDLYIAMELIEGETLESRLLRGGLGVDEALSITLQVVSALEEAHGAGVVHRDLKPGNIMLTSAGADDSFVKVVDFGIARVVDGDTRDGAVTLTGTLSGTPFYMSPEQVQGSSVDHRADLYALGLILYEMIGERRAFTGQSAVTVVMKQLKEYPPPLSELVSAERLLPGLQEVVDRAIRKDPGDRFATARLMSHALQAIRRRGQFGALWAGAGDDRGQVFEIMRQHKPRFLQLISAQIRDSVPGYARQDSEALGERLSFFFDWSISDDPDERKLHRFLDLAWFSRGLGIRLADVLGALACTFPVLRTLAGELPEDERGVLEKHWGIIERHFWLLAGAIGARWEEKATATTWVDPNPIVPRETTLPLHRLNADEPPEPEAEPKDEAGEFFENVMSSMSSGLLVVDRETRVIRSVNPALCRLLEMEADELRGHHVADALRRIRGSNLAGFIRQIEERGEVVPTKLQIRSARGRARWVTVRGGYYRDAKGRPKGVIGIVDDVTDMELVVDSFRRYVGPEVVEDLLMTGRPVTLNAHRMPVTILFVGLMGPEGPHSEPELDLDGRAESTVRTLNRYYGGVVDAVAAERGIVDSMVKDTVMGIFGAPFPHEDDPWRATRAARAIVDAVGALNQERLRDGQPALRVGLGIATGSAIVGNIGSSERVNYTAVGDVVYRADRLRNRAAPGQIILDGATRDGLGTAVPTEAVIGADEDAWRVRGD